MQAVKGKLKPKRASHAKLVNDRAALRAFWTALVQSLGGRLVHFENAAWHAAAAEPVVAQAERAADGWLQRLQRVLR